MWWADDDFPIFIGSAYFICTTHFGKAHAANNEHDNPWHIFDCCLSFVFMPMTITCTAIKIELNLVSFWKIFENSFSLPGGWCMICVTLGSSRQEWEMSHIQFILNCIFGNVFHDRCPTWHLIRVLGNAFFAWDSVWFLPLCILLRIKWIWNNQLHSP